MAIRATSEDLRILGARANDGVIAATAVNASALGGGTVARVYTTSINATLMSSLSDLSELRYTSVQAQVLATRNPNMKWIEMLQYEIFPDDISYNSVGAPKFMTDVVTVDSGADQRASRWSGVLHEYDITYAVRTMEQLHDLKTFFLAMRGKRFSFLYFDHIDHTSNVAIRTEARQPDPITSRDQTLGAGDAVTKVFQLIKVYKTKSGFTSFVRQITKPIPGRTLVNVNNADVTNFEVDKFTGQITFTPRVDSTFSHLNITPDGTDPDHVCTVQGAAGMWDAYQDGEKIVMSGWAGANNNYGENVAVQVVRRNTDGSIVTLHAANARFWQAEADRSGVRVYSHPAPRDGYIVRAGFEFYVPCRFDVDTLPMRLADFGIGDADGIKVVEVRPYSE